MLNNVNEELNKFAKSAITQSRANLKREKLNSSLDYDVTVSENSFQLSFPTEDYGIFQDKGVRGKDPLKVSTNDIEIC